MGHIGHAPFEVERCWSILSTLGIDVGLAKRAVQKLYFEEFKVAYPSYKTYYNVFFIPNETKHGSLFAMKYGTRANE